MDTSINKARSVLKSALVQLNEVKLILASHSHCAIDDVNKAIDKANLAMRRLRLGNKVERPQNEQFQKNRS